MFFRLIHAFSSPWPSFGSLTFALCGAAAPGYLGLKHVTLHVHTANCYKYKYKNTNAVIQIQVPGYLLNVKHVPLHTTSQCSANYESSHLHNNEHNLTPLRVNAKTGLNCQVHCIALTSAPDQLQFRPYFCQRLFLSRLIFIRPPNFCNCLSRVG